MQNIFLEPEKFPLKDKGSYLFFFYTCIIQHQKLM